MDTLPVFAPGVDAFVALNWLLALSSTCLLIGLFRSKRFLFVKPSMLVLCWYHFLLQWPATVFSGYYERALPDPYAFALLIHGFVLIGLVVSGHTLNLPASQVFGRLSRAVPNCLPPAIVLACYCGAVTLLYLSVVPFTSTGLYVLVTHPVLATMAREDSLKLVSSALVRYAYQTMVSAAAPLLAVYLALIGFQNARAGRYSRTLLPILGFVLLMVVSSLPGNRGNAVKLLLVVMLAALFARGLPARPLRSAALIALVLAPAVLLTVLREGKTLTGSVFYDYLTRAIFSRVFEVPIAMGAFYVHYAQTYSGFGVAGIARLANILGIDPINTPNVIGSLYSGSQLLTVSANSGYLFAYYGYFGILALPLALAGLWLLDLAVPLYLRLRPQILLPTVAAVSLTSLSFMSSDYTPVLITHGFAVVLLIAWSLNHALAAKPKTTRPVAFDTKPGTVSG
jgi:hypothetical protein